jgi:hypothetical protein
VFPDDVRVVNALVTLDRAGTAGRALTGSQRPGVLETGDTLDAPGLDDLATLAPRAGTVTRADPDGRPEELRVEVLHGYVLTLAEPNENLNGAVLDAGDDPLLVTQSTVRVTAPDGQVGYGVLERDRRRSLLGALRAREHHLPL